jgi:hypothetical protein
LIVAISICIGLALLYVAAYVVLLVDLDPTPPEPRQREQFRIGGKTSEWIFRPLLWIDRSRLRTCYKCQLAISGLLGLSLYILSYGPFMALVSRGYISFEFAPLFGAAYTPLFWARKFEPVHAVLSWYEGLWLP